MKERLVGATILVVLIVLIVPELLSGPRRAPAPPAVSGGAVESVRNVTVDLATSKATPAAEPAASAAAATESPPRIGSPPTTDGDPANQAAPAPDLRVDHAAAPSITTLKAQQPEPATVENPAPPPKSSTVRPTPKGKDTPSAPQAPHPVWAVQTGSFASRANAEKQMRRLKSHESAVYLSSGGRGAALRYRVRVGPFADRAQAERAVARLKQEGESASLVAP